MSGRQPVSSKRQVMAWILALVVAIAALGGSSEAWAETGGDTLLTLQGATDEAEAEAEDQQSRKTVASGNQSPQTSTAGSQSSQSSANGGQTPQTGDSSPVVPIALVVAGVGLVLGGRVARGRRDAALPIIPRGDDGEESQVEEPRP